MNSREFDKLNAQRLKDLEGEIKRIVYYIRKGRSYGNGEPNITGTYTVYLNADDHLIYVRNVGRYRGREESLTGGGAEVVGVYSHTVTFMDLEEDVKQVLNDTLWREMDLTRKYNL